METRNILGDFWKYVEKQNTKISEKVLLQLDKEVIFAIKLSDDKTFWIEDNYYNPPSKQVFDWIIKKVSKLYNATCICSDTNRKK